MNLHIISTSAAVEYGHGKEYVEKVVNKFNEFNTGKFEKIYFYTIYLDKNINLCDNYILLETKFGNLNKEDFVKKYKKAWRVFYGINCIYTYKRLYKEVLKNIKKQDRIYCMEYEYISMLLSKIKNYKIIFTLHTMDFNKNSYSFIESIYKIISSKCNKIIFNNAYKVIVHGNYIKNEFINKYSKFHKKVIVADYGIDIENNIVDKEVAIEYIKLKYNVEIDRKKNILLIFGLMRKNKGIDKFLENFKKLGVLNNIQLLIVGKSYDIDEKIIYNNLNKNSIWINSYIDNSDIKYFFSIADVLVLPYLKNMNSQSGPLKISMSYNTPVLCSKYGEIGNFTTEYGVGEVFDTEKYDDFNFKLCKVINNKESYLNKIKDVKNNMSWDKMAKKIWDCI